MLTAGTAALSRMLSPHDFGVSALILTVVTVASVTVGSPFEEALSQRKVVRFALFRSALSASWAASAGWIVVSLPLGLLLGHIYHDPVIGLALPLTMTATFFSGHSDILTALVRRQRRFTELSQATLIGNAMGIMVSVFVALIGGGVWALVAQRLFIVTFRAVALQWRLGVTLTPNWSFRDLGAIVRYGRVSLLDSLCDNLTFLAFNYVVGGFYGLNTLGFVNMAMRIVEPIRGAIGATGHNVAFSFFAGVQHDPTRLRERAQTIVSHAALGIAPVFIGLAAVIPVLLPLIAGPGWEDSIDVAVCLAIGSAICIPARLIFTALSAKAHPEFSLIANTSAFAATLAVLLFGAGLGPISVGLARIAGDSLQALISIIVSPDHLAWTRGARFRALAPAWALAAAMGLCVSGLSTYIPDFSRFGRLSMLIGFGIGVYIAFLAIFARQQFSGLTALIATRAKPAAS
jgi:O-antigen/teichoic acid export membrane protein